MFDQLVILTCVSSLNFVEFSLFSCKILWTLANPFFLQPSSHSEQRTPELHKSLSQSYIFCAEQELVRKKVMKKNSLDRGI